LVIGGWAAIVHGLPRSTFDVDLFVRPDPENLETLVAALSQVGFGIARELTVEELLRRHAFLLAVQIRVDLFLKPWGLESFEQCWARREIVDFDSVRIPVVGFEDLLKSKATDREKDHRDVEPQRAIRSGRLGPDATKSGEATN
jgi:hypothetical protein